jgi:hypothetical protein
MAVSNVRGIDVFMDCFLGCFFAVRCKNNKIRIKKRSQKRKFFAVYLWSKKLPFVYRGGRGGGVFGRRSAALFPLVFQDFAGPGTKKPLPRQGLLGDMSWPL